MSVEDTLAFFSIGLSPSFHSECLERDAIKDCFNDDAYKNWDFVQSLRRHKDDEKLLFPKEFFETAYKNGAYDDLVIDANTLARIGNSTKVLALQDYLVDDNVQAAKENLDAMPRDSIADVIAYVSADIEFLKMRAGTTAKAPAREIELTNLKALAKAVTDLEDNDADDEKKVKQYKAQIAFWKAFDQNSDKIEPLEKSLKIAEAKVAVEAANALVGEESDSNEWYDSKIVALKAQKSLAELEGRSSSKYDESIRKMENRKKRLTLTDKADRTDEEAKELAQLNFDKCADDVKNAEEKLRKLNNQQSTEFTQERKEEIVAVEARLKELRKEKASANVVVLEARVAAMNEEDADYQNVKTALAQAKSEANPEDKKLKSEFEKESQKVTKVQSDGNDNEDKSTPPETYTAKSASLKLDNPESGSVLEIKADLDEWIKSKTDHSEEVVTYLKEKIKLYQAKVNTAVEAYRKKKNTQNRTAAQDVITDLGRLYLALAGERAAGVKEIPGFAMRDMTDAQKALLHTEENKIKSVDDFKTFKYANADADELKQLSPFMFTLLNTCSHFMKNPLDSDVDHRFKSSTRSELMSNIDAQKAIDKECKTSGSSSVAVQLTLALTCAFIGLLL